LPTIYGFQKCIPTLERPKEQEIAYFVQRIGTGLGERKNS
jgi:hypothetical protein